MRQMCFDLSHVSIIWQLQCAFQRTCLPALPTVLPTMSIPFRLALAFDAKVAILVNLHLQQCTLGQSAYFRGLTFVAGKQHSKLTWMCSLATPGKSAMH